MDSKRGRAVMSSDKAVILVRIPVSLIARLREANPELEGISATDLVKIILRRSLERSKHA